MTNDDEHFCLIRNLRQIPENETWDGDAETTRRSYVPEECLIS